METNKLYHILLRGMQTNSTGVAYGNCYVIAKNPEDAYQKVRQMLDSHGYGYSKDRCLQEIKLLAEEYLYTETGHLLFCGEGVLDKKKK